MTTALEGWKAALLIGGGGAAGALARYGATLAMTRWLGGAWPWGTLAVNLLGSLILGALAGLVSREALSEVWRAAIMTGFLGAFTTFSTFSVEGVKMFREGVAWQGVAYLLGSVIAGVALAWGGYALTSSGGGSAG